MKLALIGVAALVVAGALLSWLAPDIALLAFANR
jgi:hypothetical protein